MLYYAGCYVLHINSCLTIPQLHNKIFDSLFFGRSYETIVSYASACIDESFSTILYPPAVERLYKAQQEGQYTAIYSSSPDFLVRLFSERFGVDAFLGTNYHIDKEGRFSHISEIVQGDVKKRYLKTMLEQFNIDLNQTVAYSDSHLDLPFLEAAGIAVGVNPDRKLKAICQKHQWEII
jgi:HAD superfamily phosphoserine phosphatase-like hydrolase